MPTQSIHALIVDDEPLARRAIAHLLDDDDDIVVVGECTNGYQAIERINNGGVDLVFLDINMPDLSGFEVLKRIHAEPSPSIILVTAHDDRAVEAFEAEAIDYLLKPVEVDRFDRAVRRAKERLGSLGAAQLGRRVAALFEHSGLPGAPPAASSGTRIPLKSTNRTLFVDPRTILWIEAAQYCVRLHRQGTTDSLNETMSKLEQTLPSDRFVRIHRSYIVNLDFVREVQPLFHGDSVVIMDDGAELRWSRTRRQAFERRLGRST